MMIIGLILLLGAGALTLLRTLAISPFADRFTTLWIWRYDFGTRYGWLVGGVILLFIFMSNGAKVDGTLAVMACWLIGLAAIWLLPARLASLL